MGFVFTRTEVQINKHTCSNKDTLTCTNVHTNTNTLAYMQRQSYVEQTNKETLVGIQIKALANELKKMLTFQNQKRKEKALGIYTEAYKYTHST